MKNIFFLLLLIPFLGISQNYISQGNVAFDTTTRQFVMNSPTNTFGNRRDVTIAKDSTLYTNRYLTTRLEFYGSSRNNGTITGGLSWFDSNGFLQRSPITSLPISSGQITSGLGFTPYNATNPSGYLDQSGARNAISVTTTGSGAASYNNSTGVINIPTPSGFAPSIASVAAGARNFNQAYQVSTTRYVDVRFSASITTNLSLTGGQSGEVYLEYSADGSTGWTLAGRTSGSNTGTLTVGLNTTQITGGQMCVILQPGYYWRMRTNNVTGTPTYAFNGGIEVTY